MSCPDPGSPGPKVLENPFLLFALNIDYYHTYVMVSMATLTVYDLRTFFKKGAKESSEPNSNELTLVWPGMDIRNELQYTSVYLCPDMLLSLVLDEGSL